MDIRIRSIDLDFMSQDIHFVGVLKVIGNRTFVTIMKAPFDGLVLGEHYYDFDRNHYNFSEEAIEGRAMWNMQMLYENAITILDRIREYADVLNSYDSYKQENNRKLSEAECSKKALSDVYDKKALDFYIEALEHGCQRYYDDLLREKKLPKINVGQLRQILAYFLGTTK